MTLNNDKFEPGTIINDFEIISELGSGATGTVYLAQHTILKKLFAIKVLNPDLAFFPEYVEIFRYEAQVIATLNHKNIVSIHTFGTFNNRYYFVMDFIKGGSLDEFITRNKNNLSKETILRIISEVTDGIEHAHHSGIIHRDIKAENILIDSDGHVKITDFGLALLETNKQKNTLIKLKLPNKILTSSSLQDPARTELKKASEVVPELEGGTTGYIAPETTKGELITTKADIYSLGALLHYLLIGETPGPNGEISAKLKKYKYRLFYKLLKKALAPDPQKRMESVSVFKNHLEQIKTYSQRRLKIIFFTLLLPGLFCSWAWAFNAGAHIEQGKSTQTMQTHLKNATNVLITPPNLNSPIVIEKIELVRRHWEQTVAEQKKLSEIILENPQKYSGGNIAKLIFPTSIKNNSYNIYLTATGQFPKGTIITLISNQVPYKYIFTEEKMLLKNDLLFLKKIDLSDEEKELTVMIKYPSISTNAILQKITLRPTLSNNEILSVFYNLLVNSNLIEEIKKDNEKITDKELDTGDSTNIEP